jgi:hypothetical protein
MRNFAIGLFGTGFLVLIAASWVASDASTPPQHPESALPLKRTPASSASASREDIRLLFGCRESGSCEKTGETLAVALAEHFTNYGADSDFARTAVVNHDPLVQAVGLRMLAALPPSPENLSALGNGLRRHSDPALTEGAVRELERYLGTQYEADAQRIVEALVAYGERTPAEHAASLVSPFINEHSYDEFRELLPRLRSDVAAARLLRSALEEYDRRRQGG